MVRIILITGDFPFTSDKNCLHKSIQSTGDKWWHFLENTWLVKTHKSTTEVAQLIVPFITQDDRLLVVEITGQTSGWLPQDAWDWIKAVQSEPDVSSLRY